METTSEPRTCADVPGTYAYGITVHGMTPRNARRYQALFTRHQRLLWRISVKQRYTRKDKLDLANIGREIDALIASPTGDIEPLV